MTFIWQLLVGSRITLVGEGREYQATVSHQLLLPFPSPAWDAGWVLRQVLPSLTWSPSGDQHRLSLPAGLRVEVPFLNQNSEKMFLISWSIDGLRQSRLRSAAFDLMCVVWLSLSSGVRGFVAAVGLQKCTLSHTELWVLTQLSSHLVRPFRWIKPRDSIFYDNCPGLVDCLDSENVHNLCAVRWTAELCLSLFNSIGADLAPKGNIL